MEAAGRRLLMRGLAPLLGGRRLPLPDWDARPRRVLFLPHEGIGDAIMSTALCREIVRRHPTLSLDVLTLRRSAPVFERAGDVASVIAFEEGRRVKYPRRVFADVRRARYDAVVDGMVARPQVKTATMALLLATGAPYRVGVAGPTNDFIYTLSARPPAPGSHRVDLLARLAVPFGIDPEAADWHPTLPMTREEREAAERAWRGAAAEGDGGRSGPRLLANISSAGHRRRWPPERYVDALRRLRTRVPELCALVLAAPEDGERAARIARESGATAATPGLFGAFALVATADLVLTPDTSIGHAASAHRVPTVSMLTNGNASLAPYRNTGRNVMSADPTIETLPVEPVVAALQSLLAGFARSEGD